MTIDEYKQFQKLICEETNIHQLEQIVCGTEKGDLAVCFWTNLGFGNKPDRLFLKLGKQELDKPKLLEKIINNL